MWILSIPIGIVALFGAYLSARKFVTFLGGRQFSRIPAISSNAEPIGYGLVFLSTAPMVVSWLMPDIILLRAVIAGLFLLYLWFGAKQIWNFFTATRRATTDVVNTVAHAIAGPEAKVVADAYLAVAALVASQAPAVGDLQLYSDKLIQKSEVTGAIQSDLLNSSLVSLRDSAEDAFGRIEVLKRLQAIRSYPEIARQLSIFAQELTKTSSPGDAAPSVLVEVDNALGL